MKNRDIIFISRTSVHIITYVKNIRPVVTLCS